MFSLRMSTLCQHKSIVLKLIYVVYSYPIGNMFDVKECNISLSSDCSIHSVWKYIPWNECRPYMYAGICSGSVLGIHYSLAARAAHQLISPGQNGHHFTNDIFECIFLNENIRILIQFSMKFVPKGPIDNKSASVEVLACRFFGTKSLHEPMLTQSTDTYIYGTRG